MLSKRYKELKRQQREADELYRTIMEANSIPPEPSTLDYWPYYYIKDFICWIKELLDNGKNEKEECR